MSHRNLHQENEHLRQRITELEQMVEELRPYRALFEHMPIPMVLYREDGLLLDMNQQNAQLLHTSPEHVIGSFNRYQDSEALQRGFVEYFDRARQGKTYRMPPTCYTPARAGFAEWEEDETICTETTYLPICDESGHVGYIGEINIDVTERIDIERALRESETRYRTIISTMQEGVIFHDSTGHIREWNTRAKEMLGRTTHTLQEYTILETISQAIHEDGTPFTEEEYPSLAALREGRPHTNVIMGIPHSDDSHTWLLVNAQPVFCNDDDTPCGVVSTYTDITAMRQTEAALQQAHEELEARVQQRTNQLERANRALRTEITERRRTQDALSASEQLYRSIVRNIPVVIFAVDMEGVFTLSEGKGLDVLNLQPGQVVGLSAYNIYHNQPEGLDAIRCAIAGKEATWTGTIMGHTFESHLTPMFDSSDTQIGVLGLAVDVTESRKAEQALRESEERFRLVTLATREAIYDWDIQKQTLWWNGAYQQLFTPNKTAQTNQNWYYQRIHPTERDSVVQRLQAAMNNSRQVWNDEYRFRSSNGSYVSLDVRSYIVRDEHGAPVRLIGSVSDITERKQAEVRHATQLAVTLVLSQAMTIDEALPWILQIIGTNFDWQWGEMWQPTPDNQRLMCTYRWNDSSLEDSTFAHVTAGITVLHGEGLAGRVWERQQTMWVDQITRDPRFIRAKEAAQAGLQSAFAFPVGTSADFNGVMCFFSRDTRSFDTAMAEMMADLGYQVSQFINRKRAEAALDDERASLARRISERTAELSVANAELARAVRAKDEFLANMSHELRTPLNAILGLTEALQEQVYGPLNERQDQILETVARSGRHLLALINDILDLSKIEAGKMQLQLDRVSVESICQTSLQFIRQQAHQKHIAISFSTDSSQTTMYADERRLKQILINLLSNAVKFTPQHGKIGLTIASDDPHHTIRFVVWDTGIGIPENQQQRLFQPFVQVDSGLDRQHEGTGLGLALVARLTELHGGSITMESIAGEGSRFTVSLPLNMGDHAEPRNTPAPAPQDAPTPAPAPNQHPEPAGMILVAEDNEATIQLFTDYLSAKGYRVVVARNGSEAIERVLEETPSIILMDIQMPGMDGLEAIRIIRADHALPHIPIIALTALAMAGDRERCLATGADDYLSKPVSLRHLIQTIQAYLGSDQPE